MELDLDENDHIIDAAISGSRTCNATKPAAPKRKLPNYNNNKQEEFFEKLVKSVTEKNEEQEDEWDLFGAMVAKQIRGLKSHVTQLKVQNDINKMLYAVRVGEMDANKVYAVRFEEVPYTAPAATAGVSGDK